MKKVNICSILILIILMASCIKKTEKVNYDTGQVKEERVYKERNDTTKYYSTSYYLNGQIKSKGNIVGGSRVGEWHEWYADGSIKWNGDYYDGIRKFQIPSINPKIIFEDSVLRKGIPTNLKVHIEGIHPEDIAVGCNNGIIKATDRKELFDCKLIPARNGVLKLIVFIRSEDEMIQFGTVSFNVVE